ncbi:MAG: XdhC family protein, partial [Longimicrobiales bacterium]
DRLRTVSAPVGLDLGAETPSEIALSITAELVQLRRGKGGGQRLVEREAVLDRLLPEPRREEVEHAR